MTAMAKTLSTVDGLVQSQLMSSQRRSGEVEYISRNNYAQPKDAGVLAEPISYQEFRSTYSAFPSNEKARQINFVDAYEGFEKINDDVDDEKLKEKLFFSLCDLKIYTAQVAMHLKREDRDLMFLQLDRIHDPDDWDQYDMPVILPSFQTFLRMMLYVKPKESPSFGLANGGHLLASWSDGDNHLSLECLEKDRLRAIMSCWVGQSRTHSATETSVDSLIKVLEPFCPRRWFGDFEVGIGHEDKASRHHSTVMP